MPRPPSLTDAQKAEALRLMASGNYGKREIARMMGIKESTLRRNISAQSAQVQVVAGELVAAEQHLAQLPQTAQRVARGLAENMLAAQDNYGYVVERTSRSAVKVANIVGKIIDSLPDDVLEGDKDTVAERLEKAGIAGGLQKLVIASLQPTATLMTVKKDTTDGGAKTLEDLLSESWEGK